MSDVLIEFAELIYPDDFEKQTQLMEDIMNMQPQAKRLKELNPAAFRAYYEWHKHVPLLPDSHLEDMFAIMGRN